MLPGWFVILFGVVAVLAPCSVLYELFGKSKPLTSIQLLPLWINVAVYAIPCLIAAIFFGINNVRCGRDKIGSTIGLILAALSLLLAGAMALMLSGR